MKQLFIGLLITIAITCFSCKEEAQNQIKGKITSYPELNSIENVNAKLDAMKISQGSFTNTWEEIGTTSTDQNGDFDFSFEAMRVHKYKLTLSHEDYRSKIVEFEPLDYSGTYNQSHVLVKNGNLEVHIKNQNYPIKPTDEFRIRISDIPEECSDCTLSEFIILEGAIDTTITFQLVGDDDVNIEYVIEKGNSEYISIWQNILANQTTYKTIIY